MPPSRSALLAAADSILREVAAQPEYARTSHLRVLVDGEVLYDRHLRGPQPADVFSVTKSVVATLVGAAVAQRGARRDPRVTVG